MQCKVKSLIAPHIKWLKKMEPNEKSSMNTLTVGADRYRILRAEGDISVGNDEYLNKLVIGQASLQDAGLYICFVTNGGFGALTYKAMTLRVEKRKFIVSFMVEFLLVSLKAMNLFSLVLRVWFEILKSRLLQLSA